MNHDYWTKFNAIIIFKFSFHKNMDQLINLHASMPRQAGNEMKMVLERGQKIVPSINEAFPKPKVRADNPDPTL